MALKKQQFRACPAENGRKKGSGARGGEKYVIKGRSRRWGDGT